MITVADYFQQNFSMYYRHDGVDDPEYSMTTPLASNTGHSAEWIIDSGVAFLKQIESCYGQHSKEAADHVRRVTKMVYIVCMGQERIV